MWDKFILRSIGVVSSTNAQTYQLQSAESVLEGHVVMTCIISGLVNSSRSKSHMGMRFAST